MFDATLIHESNLEGDDTWNQVSAEFGILNG
jgi:hypothetical protein